jgi:glutaredoxin 3
VSSPAAGADAAVFTQPGYRRPLHWVFKVGDLKASLDFYERVFGMKARPARRLRRWAALRAHCRGARPRTRVACGLTSVAPLGLGPLQVHRHEEFASGCEATCNGPYGGAWSKTMVRSARFVAETPVGCVFCSHAPLHLCRAPQIGYGTEETHFALELTYNYGVDRYENGNDLRCAHALTHDTRSLHSLPVPLVASLLHRRGAPCTDAPRVIPSSPAPPPRARRSYIAISRAAVRDASGVSRDADGREFVTAPDGYRFLLVDAPLPPGGEPFQFVSIATSDLAAARAYYLGALGAAERLAGSVRGALGTKESLALGWGPAGGVALELVALPPGVKVERGTAPGRFASETEDGAPTRVAAAVTAAAGAILHGPLVLQPHGEEVVIVQDGDGHEYCFVDARGYRACTSVARRAGGAVVDWAYRARLAAAAALTGEAAKAGVAAVLAGDYDVAAVKAKLAALAASAPVVVFSQTSCPYCKKAKALLAATGVRNSASVELDALGAEGYALRVELGKLTGRTSVPNVFIAGASVGGFSDGPGVNTLAEQGKLAGMLRDAGAL